MSEENVEKVVDARVKAMLARLGVQTEMPKEPELRKPWNEKLKLAEWMAGRRKQPA